MSSTSVGSFRYMSPERLIGDQYDSSGDIWSLGIMIIQLWTKSYPFSSVSSPIDLLTELEEMDVKLLTRRLPKSMGEIVGMMLVNDPESRGSCMELLESEWFIRSSIYNIRDAKEVIYQMFCQLFFIVIGISYHVIGMRRFSNTFYIRYVMFFNFSYSFFYQFTIDN